MARRSKTPAPEVVHPFISGWAISSHAHRILHALPFPLDLGEFGQALCGAGAIGSKGWQEIPDEAPFYSFRCSPCVNKFRIMYDEDDERLTPQDRQAFRDLVHEYEEAIRKAD